jgi:serine/threonine protein kinase
MIENIGVNEDYVVPRPSTNYNSELIDIMYRCLNRDPQQRPTFSVIINLLENTKHLSDRYIIKQLYDFYGPSPTT